MTGSQLRRRSGVRPSRRFCANYRASPAVNWDRRRSVTARRLSGRFGETWRWV